ncbi:taste receptor type 2 member 7-like [Microcaecilia unicolor]|uniref:Taste receptor type 2 n=1 Tax=Microcaecilia unicolor TaxID=1415580 RepID=A0A6P7WHF5_9AMPH|nr:taste receptor type 2 member 7-like [Microcaecilia unicolor]
MAVRYTIAYHIIIGLESFIGILANTFIITVNGVDWVRSQQLTPCDLILITLALSRLIWLWAFAFNNIYMGVRENEIEAQVRKIFFVLWNFLDLSSLWYATCLCVFYCAKVAEFRSPLFLRLKARIPRMVPQLLLGTQLLSFVFNLPLIFSDIWLASNSSHDNSTQGNSTDTAIGMGQFVWRVYPYLLPSVVFCSMALLLIASLCKHVRRMVRSRGGPQGPRLMAHFSALRFVVFFLFFYLAYIIAIVYYYIYKTSFASSEEYICMIVIEAYPSLHSIVLIQGNTKLREAYTRVLWKHKKSVKDRGVPGSQM